MATFIDIGDDPAKRRRLVRGFIDPPITVTVVWADAVARARGECAEYEGITLILTAPDNGEPREYRLYGARGLVAKLFASEIASIAAL